MAKAAIFLPGSIAVDTVRQALSSFTHIEPVIITDASTEDLKEHVRKLIVENCCVFIARGLQAEMLKTMSALPVVPLQITAQELGLLIQNIKQSTGLSHPRIALIGAASMFGDTSSFNLLFDVDIRRYTMHTPEEAVLLVERAINDQADLLIGGRHVCAAAKSRSMPAYFAAGGTEGLNHCLEIADEICQLNDTQTKENAEMMTMITNNFNGIIKVGHNGCIELINLVMESILQKESYEVEGKPIQEVLPDFEESYIERALQKGERTFSYMMRINGMGYAVNISPSSSGGKVTCVYLTFQEQKQISELDHKLRNEMYSKGRFAHYHFEDYEWKSPSMRKTVETAKRFSRYSAPILINGERGTEKSILAQCIHSNSLFSDGPFVSGECGAWRQEEMAERLFGINKEEESLLEMSQGGTLYLKNIELMTPQCQYILHTLLSGGEDLSSMDLYAENNVRILASSEQNLAALVEAGKFRSDLYYELSMIDLPIEPLRNRPEDLAFLIPHYMNVWQHEYSRHVHLSEGAMKVMQNYEWPGNVQQLANFCQRLILYSERPELSEGFVNKQLKEAFPIILKSSSHQYVEFRDPNELKLKNLLEKNHWDRQKTADELGISKTTLWRRMKKYGMEES